MRARLPARRGCHLAPWQPNGNTCWPVPPRHWIKVNTDSARNTNSDLASFVGDAAAALGSSILIYPSCRCYGTSRLAWQDSPRYCHYLDPPLVVPYATVMA
ncbi:hypothetical protein V6N11_001894 [Hibiscus sabdariffa]|uniref:Uncharacterized protein n=1 Tax=Hibiscus sabdariffa TaxID=183260 RepID=A0ABR2QTS0_9ROSI